MLAAPRSGAAETRPAGLRRTGDLVGARHPGTLLPPVGCLFLHHCSLCGHIQPNPEANLAEN